MGGEVSRLLKSTDFKCVQSECVCRVRCCCVRPRIILSRPKEQPLGRQHSLNCEVLVLIPVEGPYCANERFYAPEVRAFKGM